MLANLTDLLAMASKASAYSDSLDGTYVVREVDYVNGRPVLELVRVYEPDGFEVAYDQLNTGVEVPSLFLEPGQRIGFWVDPETGQAHIDRTVHLRGPEELARSLGESYQQVAIWNWKAQSVIRLGDVLIDQI